jgi:hypothetical protein
MILPLSLTVTAADKDDLIPISSRLPHMPGPTFDRSQPFIQHHHSTSPRHDFSRGS